MLHIHRPYMVSLLLVLHLGPGIAQINCARHIIFLASLLLIVTSFTENVARRDVFQIAAQLSSPLRVKLFNLDRLHLRCHELRWRSDTSSDYTILGLSCRLSVILLALLENRHHELAITLQLEHAVRAFHVD